MPRIDRESFCPFDTSSEHTGGLDGGIPIFLVRHGPATSLDYVREASWVRLAFSLKRQSTVSQIKNSGDDQRLRNLSLFIFVSYVMANKTAVKT